MSRDRSHLTEIGLLVATSLASMVFALATLSGFETASSGGVVVSSFGPANLSLYLFGALLLLGMEFLHMRSHHARSHYARRNRPSHSQSMTSAGAIVRI